jgi:hypothetical protein
MGEGGGRRREEEGGGKRKEGGRRDEGRRKKGETDLSKKLIFFLAAWAIAQAGLSKVNPDINTSEDVFAGFKCLECSQNTKHVEHIQFQKGKHGRG